MPKIKFTAFATNTKTGERTYGPGEMNIPSYIPRANHHEAVRQQMAREGYKDVHIDNSTTDDS